MKTHILQFLTAEVASDDVTLTNETGQIVLGHVALQELADWAAREGIIRPAHVDAMVVSGPGAVGIKL